MSEKAICSKMGLITGGTHTPTTSRRLKFGPFSKDFCYVIGGHLIIFDISTTCDVLDEKADGNVDNSPLRFKLTTIPQPLLLTF